MKLAAAYSADRTTMKKVRANKPPRAKQRALPLRATGELAPAIRGRLHRIWRAPPQLAAEAPHFWRNLLGTAQLAPQASEKRWNRLLRRLNYVLMSPPGNLGQVEAYHLGPISGGQETRPLIGQPWRGVEASTGGLRLQRKARPITSRGRGAARTQVSHSCDSQLICRV